ncbi:MAG: NUDIX domain-containing protein [Bacteroidetes bacterium]|jgi:predicted NUDIX family NTP pyrophosphohydrolase|nr:NUDIX domain-containing protein [Bacteroidota bacterium]
MPKRSAGLLLYRYREGQIQVFLVHPGGPFWKNKDEGSWMIPKGEIDEGEEALPAAQREFREETGFELPEPPYHALPTIKQAGGKVVEAFAVEGNCDPEQIKSNTFEMEWPPKSGQQQAFPEIDRAAWHQLPTAARKMLKSQRPLLNALEEAIK